MPLIANVLLYFVQVLLSPEIPKVMEEWSRNIAYPGRTLCLCAFNLSLLKTDYTGHTVFVL
jgi:hypothetical protein